MWIKRYLSYRTQQVKLPSTLWTIRLCPAGCLKALYYSRSSLLSTGYRGQVLGYKWWWNSASVEWERLQKHKIVTKGSLIMFQECLKAKKKSRILRLSGRYQRSWRNSTWMWEKRWSIQLKKLALRHHIKLIFLTNVWTFSVNNKVFGFRIRLSYDMKNYADLCIIIKCGLSQPHLIIANYLFWTDYLSLCALNHLPLKDYLGPVEAVGNWCG